MTSNEAADSASAVVRVLVVDDQPIVIEALRRILEPEADVEFLSSREAGSALEFAKARRPTVILQDLVMPGGDGFALLASYCAAPELEGVPVIVLSAKEDPRDKSRAFSLGASDYLVKLPDRIELLARVRAHSRSFVARRERDAAFRELERLRALLEAQNVELARLSTIDGLTGLANRRRFDEMLDAELRRAVRDDNELSLIMTDVDHFKRYNDRYGHVGGDTCLKRIADAMRECVRRPADLIARYGGEEFGIVLPNTTCAGAQLLAETIRLRVANMGLEHAASDVAPHVTLTLGVASVPAGVQRTPAELIERADRALYAAKRDGRNRTAVAARDDPPS
jgi:two-component system chemotaxis family response regulator WspR